MPMESKDTVSEINMPVECWPVYFDFCINYSDKSRCALPVVP